MIVKDKAGTVRFEKFIPEGEPRKKKTKKHDDEGELY
jgi:hypothetical protein